MDSSATTPTGGVDTDASLVFTIAADLTVCSVRTVVFLFSTTSSVPTAGVVCVDSTLSRLDDVAGLASGPLVVIKDSSSNTEIVVSSSSVLVGDGFSVVTAVLLGDVVGIFLILVVI